MIPNLYLKETIFFNQSELKLNNLIALKIIKLI